MLLSAALPAKEISIVCGTEGFEISFCESGARRWAEQSGNTVRVIRAEKPSMSRFRELEQILQIGAPDLDVIQLDITWAGPLSEHLLTLDDRLDDGLSQHIVPLRRLATLDDGIRAVPWYLSLGRLFYRKDLLSRHGENVPTSWVELEASAARIQQAERSDGNAQIWGFVWQGRANEALTSNALEWFAGHGAGALIAPDGSPNVTTPGVLAALRRATGWVGAISPPGVLEFGEDESLQMFNEGRAVYMRQWSSFHDATQAEDSKVKGLVGTTSIPDELEDRSIGGTLGGWMLGVSRYSREPALAVELVRYLTGAEEQRRRALEGGFSPTLLALYEDEPLMRERPRLAEVRDELEHAVVRPSRESGRRYVAVSSAIAQAVHEVLSERAEAEPRLQQLKEQLEIIARGGSRW